MEAAALASQLPKLCVQLKDLIGKADETGFKAFVQVKREQADPSAIELMNLAHAALQIGLMDEADGLVLEADSLHPNWQLVPDRWGLWTQPESCTQTTSEEDQKQKQCISLRDQYRTGVINQHCFVWLLPAVKKVGKRPTNGSRL